MEENEIKNVYPIPANYTDSGKLFGGLLEIRNTVEAVFLLLIVGYPELMWLPVSSTFKIIIMTVTLLPLGIVALMGIGGDTLFEFITHMILHFFRRRKLHYKRIGGVRVGQSTKKPGKAAKNEAKKTSGKKAREQPKG